MWILEITHLPSQAACWMVKTIASWILRPIARVLAVRYLLLLLITGKWDWHFAAKTMKALDKLVDLSVTVREIRRFQYCQSRWIPRLT